MYTGFQCYQKCAKCQCHEIRPSYVSVLYLMFAVCVARVAPSTLLYYQRTPEWPESEYTGARPRPPVICILTIFRHIIHHNHPSQGGAKCEGLFNAELKWTPIIATFTVSRVTY